MTTWYDIGASECLEEKEVQTTETRDGASVAVMTVYQRVVKLVEQMSKEPVAAGSTSVGGVIASGDSGIRIGSLNSRGEYLNYRQAYNPVTGALHKMRTKKTWSSWRKIGSYVPEES